jgi:LPXTG-site transpeptidase (sortase) family protein
VLLGLLLVLAGAQWWRSQEVGGGPRPEAGATPSDGDASTVVAGRRLPEAEPAPRRPGDPVRLQIPDLDVDAHVVPILAPGGVLTPPADPQELGWWADGARPGDVRGSALVTGHTVSTGGGALDDLEDLEEGDALRVRSDGSGTDYAVESVRILAKGDLGERAEALFSQDVPGRLVVVTCEDWNGTEYLSNVVVTATPTGAG